jgi:hypothetical protein
VAARPARLRSNAGGPDFPAERAEKNQDRAYGQDGVAAVGRCVVRATPGNRHPATAHPQIRKSVWPTMAVIVPQSGPT